MAQLLYNGYAFAPDSVSFNIDAHETIGGTGRANFVTWMWVIDGRISGVNTADVVAKIEAMLPYMVDGGDLVFSIYHSLLSADCVEGTHVYDLKFSKGYDGVRGSGAELVLRRTFRLVIGGKKLVTSDTDIIAYHESVTGSGTGGPIIHEIRSLYGPVQAQQTVAQTAFKQYQSGFAIGNTAYPAAASPIWQAGPAYYFPDQCSVTLETPQRFGINRNTGFKVSWRYCSWFTSPLVSSPLPPF